MRRSKYSTTCVVCSSLINTGHHNYRQQTCGDYHCRAVLMLQPDVRDPAKVKPTPLISRNKKIKPENTIRDRLKAYVTHMVDDEGAKERHQEHALHFGIDTSDWAFSDDIISADVRGLANEASRDLWGYLSRAKVAFRARTKAATVWLHIRRLADESTADAVRRGLMANTGWEDIYDLFLAWRCCCPVQSEYRVKQLQDIPDEPGPHGNCPNCGATPLYVEVI